MADDIQTLRAMRFQKACDLRLRTGKRIVKGSTAAILIKCDPPTVPMRTCAAATLGEPGQTEPNIGRDIAVHAEQFAHLQILKEYQGFAILLLYHRSFLLTHPGPSIAGGGPQSALASEPLR